MQKTSLNTRSTGDFPGGSVVKSPLLPQQGAQVQSLAIELRYCMLHCAAKKEKKVLKSFLIKVQNIWNTSYIFAYHLPT